MIGIGPMDYYHPISWPKRNAEIYNSYLLKLVNFAAWLIENNYKVMLFPGVCGTDDNVIVEFKACLTKFHPEVSHNNLIIPDIQIY